MKNDKVLSSRRVDDNGQKDVAWSEFNNKPCLLVSISQLQPLFRTAHVSPVLSAPQSQLSGTTLNFTLKRLFLVRIVDVIIDAQDE